MVRICTGEVWVRRTSPDSCGPDPEGVLQGARRVVRRHVEGVEVVPLGLDLGTLRPLVAHRDEQVGDPLHQRGQRVPGPGRDPVPGQRDVDGLLDQDPLVALLLELGLPGGQRLGHLAAGAPDPLAGVGLRGRGQGADLPVGERQWRPVAGVLEADGLELVEVVGGLDRGQGVVAGLLDLVGVQRGHLHGVVGLVRCGHRMVSGARDRRPSLGVVAGRTTDGRAGVDGPAPARRPGTSRQSAKSGVAAGSTNRNLAPPDGACPTSMWPPCASTRPRTM